MLQLAVICSTVMQALALRNSRQAADKPAMRHRQRLDDTSGLTSV